MPRTNAIGDARLIEKDCVMFASVYNINMSIVMNSRSLNFGDDAGLIEVLRKVGEMRTLRK